MANEPRFYTTTVDAAKSANEIGEIVHKYGASSFTVHYGHDREPVGVSFVMEVPNVGPVPVQLRAQTESLEKRLRRVDRWFPGGAETQAKRVAWRQLKTLIEMQLELVENGVRPFHTMFLGDVLRSDGMTIGDWVEEQRQLPGVEPLQLTGYA